VRSVAVSCARFQTNLLMGKSVFPEKRKSPLKSLVNSCPLQREAKISIRRKVKASPLSGSALERSSQTLPGRSCSGETLSSRRVQRCSEPPGRSVA